MDVVNTTEMEPPMKLVVLITVFVEFRRRVPCAVTVKGTERQGGY
jgi:hypothetical protein